VSSVNALGLGALMRPADEESALAGIVECPYVVTKREAERVVLAEVERGLAATIVNPGFMLGPWDWKPSSGKMLLAVTKFAPLAPLGAASFCDVRDVAAGAIAAARRGASGQRYILAGHNLSYWNAWKQMAGLVGKRGPLLPMGPLFRAASLPVLEIHRRVTRREGDANAATLMMGRQEHCFSSARAERELGYRIRPLAETMGDTLAWFREHAYA
jgi:dihydroflavonol-4-reductase